MTPAERLAWLMDTIELVHELQAKLRKPLSSPEPMEGQDHPLIQRESAAVEEGP